MKRSTIALALAVVCGCSPDRLTSAASPAGQLDLAPAADGTPLVYAVENTGASIPATAFPAFADLPLSMLLPDPFTPYLGGARNTTLAGWEARRAEFKSSIEQFEIGTKPSPSDVTVAATYTPGTNTATEIRGTINVVVTRPSNGRTLTLSSAITRPLGSDTGAVGAIIGMNSPSGSVPADIFTSRNLARITFSHNQVTTYFGKSAANPYYQMYPEYAATGASGQYSAWSWGISRLIDGIQILAQSGALTVDPARLGVTGCSYAGKMALYAGALDERIALTIAQESGGGGAPSWRVNHAIEPDGRVEKTDNTDGNWFINNVLKTQFRADSVYRLPDDHHELMAMVAPRALLATGNTDFEWLGNEANYVTSRATAATFETLGVGDRFGFYIDGGHGHCAVPATQQPAMAAFVDRFLMGRSATTDLRVHPATFANMNYQQWMPWATGPSTLKQVAMDVQPGQISASSTAVVNVVLYGAADFDAAAVNAADTRLVVNGGVNDGTVTNAVAVTDVPPVAPITRGSSVNTSLADVNGDGRIDRVIGFSMSALSAAGYGRNYHTLWLRPASAPYSWMAFDVTGNSVTRPNVVP